MPRNDRQTKPGLVALYDIRTGNGVGLFLQPWSPHGAHITEHFRDQFFSQSSALIATTTDQQKNPETHENKNKLGPVMNAQNTHS